MTTNNSEPACYYPGIRYCKYYFAMDENCQTCGYAPGGDQAGKSKEAAE